MRAKFLFTLCLRCRCSLADDATTLTDRQREKQCIRIHLKMLDRILTILSSSSINLLLLENDPIKCPFSVNCQQKNHTRVVEVEKER